MVSHKLWDAKTNEELRSAVQISSSLIIRNKSRLNRCLHLLNFLTGGDILAHALAECFNLGGRGGGD